MILNVFGDVHGVENEIENVGQTQLDCVVVEELGHHHLTQFELSWALRWRRYFCCV
jgi:hypothetical protein